ncbi:MAG: hypothetical protein QOH85_1742, partial [Acidobacteriaceae bacterium]|nr:hypothetical protein [Acidobacteriaceae bacterium]
MRQRLRVQQRKTSLSSSRIRFYPKSQLLVLLLVVAGALSASAQQPRSIPEEIEWT